MRASPSNTLPLLLGSLALLIAVAGVLAPQGGAGPAAESFELVLFGDSLDDVRLKGDAPPELVYRVPRGVELQLSDVDATAVGLVLWRRSQQQLVQVGFVDDDGAVGFGQSSRSYAMGIPFGPDDELLVQPAAGDVEWVALRGVLRAVEAPLAGP